MHGRLCIVIHKSSFTGAHASPVCRWFDKEKGMTKELFPAQRELDIPKLVYTVRVFTSDLKGAGRHHPSSSYNNSPAAPGGHLHADRTTAHLLRDHGGCKAFKCCWAHSMKMRSSLRTPSPRRPQPPTQGKGISRASRCTAPGAGPTECVGSLQED
ncbi:uncharacterized protein HaLaN_07642 [Haematococcus lacustris]|uniref:Uncharacterized protein n=1 Tax=Haematococcus lacustris TaxID=44745 RepID=A0A699YZ45_HAELA|nr:uncharacterized protein HaLaN_07642 [Haematococcus lacustris]